MRSSVRSRLAPPVWLIAPLPARPTIQVRSLPPVAFEGRAASSVSLRVSAWGGVSDIVKREHIRFRRNTGVRFGWVSTWLETFICRRQRLQSVGFCLTAKLSGVFEANWSFPGNLRGLPEIDSRWSPKPCTRTAADHGGASAEGFAVCFEWHVVGIDNESDQVP